MRNNWQKRRSLTTGEVASLLDVAPRTVKKWFDKGKLQGYKLPGCPSGDQRRIHTDSVRAFMQARGIPLAWLGQADLPQVLLASSDTCLIASLSRCLAESEVALKFAGSILELGSCLVERPAILVLDFGLDCRANCLAALRSIASTEPVSLIMAILNEDDGAQDAMAFGAETFRKPVDPSILAQMIQKHLEASSRPGQG